MSKGNPDLWRHAYKGRHKQASTMRGRQQTAEHKAKRAASVAETLAATIRICDECGREYTPTQGAQRYCSGQCWNRAARRKRKNPERFTMPRAQYQQLLVAQNHCCAICGIAHKSNGRRNSLAVDHVHGTDRVRGLLCHRCNTAIGLLGDDPVRLQRAFEYLMNESRFVVAESEEPDLLPFVKSTKG